MSRCSQPSYALFIGLSVGLLTAGSASASDALWTLQSSLQSCMQSAQAQACRNAQAAVNALKLNRAYAQSSHLCKEEIAELSQVLALMPMRDAVATDVMSTIADVQQACLPFGF